MSGFVSHRFAVIIVAAGKSQRFTGQRSGLELLTSKKPFTRLMGRAVWVHSAERFSHYPEVQQIILVVSPEDRQEVARKFQAEIALYGFELADGGTERFLSVENGLKQVKSNLDYVAIHDAARPCISDQDIRRVLDEAVRSQAALLAVPVVGTIKRARKTSQQDPADVKSLRKKQEFVFGEKSEPPRQIETTVPRENLWEAQTPQVFQKTLLQKAFEKRGTFVPTDDAQLVEHLNHLVTLVPSSPLNIKITSPMDLQIAEKYLEILNRNSPKKLF